MIVDVVLCGECEWFHVGGCMNEKVVGNYYWIKRKEDAFCSEGKRRDQDE